MACIWLIFVQAIIALSTNYLGCYAQNNNQIFPNFHRTIYRRWDDHPIELYCPLKNPSLLLWHSVQTVYKVAFGCLDGANVHLVLPVFPDVENIKFNGFNTTHQVICTFRLTGELIEANALLLLNGNDQLEVDIFALPGTTLTFNTTICKTGVIRNGSCSSLDAVGTSFVGEQVNRRLLDHFIVRYSVQARDGDKHQCMGSIDGKIHSFVVRVKADLDECTAAASESIQLCRAECQNLTPGYRCSNGSYSIPCSDFKTDGWMCLRDDRRHYPPSTVKLDGAGTCELTANEGHHFCPNGAMDCIDSPYGPKCQTFVEAPSNRKFNSFPSSESPVDLELLLRKASTDKNLTHLVQRSVPLLWRNSHEWIQVLGNITKTTAQRMSAKLFEVKDAISSENLLQSIEVLLNLHTHRQKAVQSSEIEPISVSGIVQSASALLNVFSALSGDQEASSYSLSMADEYTVQRNGLELRRIRINKNQTDMQNESTVMRSQLSTSDSSTALVITIPVGKLQPFLGQSESTTQNASLTDRTFDNLKSDVYIVHSWDSISLFRLRMASNKEQHEDVTCHLWDLLNRQNRAFESQTCLTQWISEKYYECRCSPSTSGAFAVGLVYIMSSKDLKNLQIFGPTITIINYACSAITICALSLFLFFTRFVGVFRLDQFHIALSLMLGTLVSLFIPHVSEDFEFLCAVIAILVNYFPLCAFAWKFVLGLNTLLVVIAPRTNFSELFTLQVVYIPVTVCAYLVPGLIVGFWFGMARQFKSDLELCIGPDLLGYRWPLLAPITAVVLFNLIVLSTVGIIVLRNYLAIRRSRVNKSTHLLVLVQLMLTLGIPYMLIYVQIISPSIMLLILPIGIALTAVFMFLLVAVIDDENRHLLHLLLTSMCSSTRRTSQYPSNGSNGRANYVDNIKSTSISYPDAFLVTDEGHSNHLTPTLSVNNTNATSSKHEYFNRSRNRFAMEDDLTMSIIHQPINDEGSNAVLVPLDVSQLPTQYYYNPHSPHHTTPVIRFESLHDLVMTPAPEFNDSGRIIHCPMAEEAYPEGFRTLNFHPRLCKQFANRTVTSPNSVNSYYLGNAAYGT